MKAVGKGYSMLKSEDFGISPESILDARLIFANTIQPVYSDNCCHLNQEGEKILARAIAVKIIRWVLST